MGMYDVLSYVITAVPNATYDILNYTVQSVGLKSKNVEPIKLITPDPLWKMARATGPFHFTGALSGATAISIGIYASNENFLKKKSEDQRELLSTALNYHLIHSLVFIALPTLHRPILAGTFITAGLFLFCGTHYYYVFSDKTDYQFLTKPGSICFILGWISMIF